MTCPNCKSKTLDIFYQIEKVPVNSVLLLTSRDEALNFPRGHIKLAYCQACGFVTNIKFKQELLEYSSRYEGTQAFSSTFNSFNRKLAQYLIERYDLYRKTILEVGCGQGEFLELLCEMGENEGIGFDPAFTEERSHLNSKRVSIIKDFYSQKYSHINADFICCKMTLEHIQNTGQFVWMVRDAVGEALSTLVFFQVPNARRIWRELAFWDIYYEHCSYFDNTSLSFLFRKSGFKVDACWTAYNDQYLMLTAVPQWKNNLDIPVEKSQLQRLDHEIELFALNSPLRISLWEKRIKNLRRQGKRIVIWGAGSKGVAFLTTLNLNNEIEYCVDVNPYKQGTFMPGTGQEIVAPEFLQKYRPDVIIVMNPIYTEEIHRDLRRMGVNAKLLPV